MLSFQPKSITRELLAELPGRSRRVLSDRFGLSNSGEERTLDAIGKEYNITRERVRQIENHSIVVVRESEVYGAHKEAFEELRKAMDMLGSVVAEEALLNAIAKRNQDRNHLLFLLTVAHVFDSRREDSAFRTRWYLDKDLADSIERALITLYESLAPDRLTPEEEFLDMFSRELKLLEIKNRSLDTLRHYLKLSKRLGKNPLGEWGRIESPHVRIKNTRDFAYLTLKRHGSPMHFTEVARGIEQLFKRMSHPATTHNELIKDNRFVLVGRGLYALREWGYEPGVVRDVIRGVLDREGPLSREEIVERVKRERYVKDATISVNLQNGIFTKLADGRYALAK